MVLRSIENSETHRKQLNGEINKVILELGMACKIGNDKVVKVILSDPIHRRLIHAQGDSGNTGFLYSCILGHLNLIDLFLNDGDSNKFLNSFNFDGNSGLILACRNDHHTIVQRILNHPATTFEMVNSRNNDVDRALDIVQRNPYRYKKIRPLLLRYYELL